MEHWLICKFNQFYNGCCTCRNWLNSMKSNLFFARELALACCCVRWVFCIYFFLIKILRLWDCCCCCRLCCSMTKTIMLSVNSLRLVALCGVKSVKFINIHSRRSTLWFQIKRIAASSLGYINCVSSSIFKFRPRWYWFSVVASFSFSFLVLILHPHFIRIKCYSRRFRRTFTSNWIIENFISTFILHR